MDSGLLLLTERTNIFQLHTHALSRVSKKKKQTESLQISYLPCLGSLLLLKLPCPRFKLGVKAKRDIHSPVRVCLFVSLFL